MKGFFERLQWKMAGWMQGRHGVDGLSNFLIGVGFILVIASVIPGLDVLSWPALACMALSLVRCCSKNETARCKEEAAYQRIAAKPKAVFSLASKRFKNRNTTAYFKCKGCGKVLSVPKGKGKIRVTCPNCQAQSERKS